MRNSPNSDKPRKLGIGRLRHRSVSEPGAQQGSFFSSSGTPSPEDRLRDRLPSVEENSPVLAPPSPGTPPKKTWEQQYRSFLSRRRLGGSNVPTELPGPPPLTHAGRRSSTQETLKSQQIHSKSSEDSVKTTGGDSATPSESSVRGGKLFANIFRNNESSTPTKHKRRVKSFSHTDELDDTLRRGSEKAYSPGNQRFRKLQTTAQSHDRLDRLGAAARGDSNSRVGYLIPPVDLRPASLNGADVYTVQSALMRTSSSPPSAISHAPQQLQSHGGDEAANVYTVQSALMRGSSSPPTLLSHTPQRHKSHGGDELDMKTHRPVADGVVNAESFLFRGAPIIQQQQQVGDESLDTSSSAIKRAFTEFHNSAATGRDAVSAYLGDDPSWTGHSLAWTQTSRSLVRRDGGGAPSRIATALSHGDLAEKLAAHSRAQSSPATCRDSVDIAKGMRILKPILGVESWQQGRRYLIAPAVLAACPLPVFSTFSAKEKLVSAEDAARESSVFGGILLGDCLLSYIGMQKNETSSVQQWSSATLVLVGNYLLEFDPDDVDLKHVPRGYAHLEHAQCHVHNHFADALELLFYGSPCARSDKRTLMIRIMRRHERESWATCLNRAAMLTVEDMFDVDRDEPLGTGSYSSVYRGMRRSARTEDGEDSSKQPLVRNRAFKIFEKSKFWRHVVNGRERADTIVRETSVQATLTARCGNVASFLSFCGFFETSQHVVLELELLDGRDLFNYISSKNALSEKEAAHMLRDILLSLDAMNRTGIAHRDIKPANILMCPVKSDSLDQGENIPRVKVCDFGMSTFVGVDGQVRGRCGTPGYVAPEIFSAGPYGGYGNKVDIFSTGVTLYVMLCGYEPFYGETDAELVEANKAAHIEFPDEEWSCISENARDLIQGMMQPDPTQRLDSKRALEHPWITENVETEATVGRTSESTIPNVDACVIS